MSVSELLSYLNITAMVLGYIVLMLLLAGVFWLVSTRLEAWRYKRRRQRRHDIEWDNIRSKWLDEKIPIQRFDTLRQYAVGQDRLDTDVMEHTLEQIINYQKEHNPHDAS